MTTQRHKTQCIVARTGGEECAQTKTKKERFKGTEELMGGGEATTFM
jgi:hypothetical protein